MLDMAMVTACSPNIHPAIVQAIVKTESTFNPFAIGVNNGAGRLSKQPTSYNQAVSTAKALLARGANIDMGLGQINSANLNWLNLSVEQAFTPCSNLKALQTVYLSCYANAGNSGLGDKMQRAFSCYNTGNTTKGFYNGYVAKATYNFNGMVDYLAKQTHQLPYQQPDSLSNTPTYAVKNGSITLVEPQQDNLATQVLPIHSQNANTVVSVRLDDTFTSLPNPENLQTADGAIKVHNSWDIFRDF